MVINTKYLWHLVPTNCTSSIYSFVHNKQTPLFGYFKTTTPIPLIHILHVISKPMLYIEQIQSKGFPGLKTCFVLSTVNAVFKKHMKASALLECRFPWEDVTKSKLYRSWDGDKCQVLEDKQEKGGCWAWVWLNGRAPAYVVGSWPTRLDLELQFHSLPSLWGETWIMCGIVELLDTSENLRVPLLKTLNIFSSPKWWTLLKAVSLFGKIFLGLVRQIAHLFTPFPPKDESIRLTPITQAETDEPCIPRTKGTAGAPISQGALCACGYFKLEVTGLCINSFLTVIRIVFTF